MSDEQTTAAAGDETRAEATRAATDVAVPIRSEPSRVMPPVSDRATWKTMGGVRWPEELRLAFQAESEAERAAGQLSTVQHLVINALNDLLASRPPHSDYARELHRLRGIDLQEPGE